MMIRFAFMTAFGDRRLNSGPYRLLLICSLLLVFRANLSAAGGDPNGWTNLFDGKTLGGWKVTDFAGHGEVKVEEGQLRLPAGVMLTGVSWTNALPEIDYEVSLEAEKVDGSDFFCGLTFPVEKSFCTLIVGGWGGGVVGLSSIDGMDASENGSTKYMKFDTGRWYRIRLRVARKRIEAWIDDELFVDQSIEGREISLRAGDIELSKPFGLATWQTTGALRAIRIRRLPGTPTGK
jgi:3-keto-disaccharide hydrolase